MENGIIKKSKSGIRKWIQSQTLPYKQLMSYYNCALMEVETKFKVLNESFSIRYGRNPIQSIKTRIKTPESVWEKLDRKGLPKTVEAIEENIKDVAGIRVICAYPSDVYQLAEALLKQDDVMLIKRKDYILNPKANGYRSLHLIIAIPIFLYDRKKMMNVEVQIRTMAMDWWASLEHEIRYKKENYISEQVQRELFECAEMCDVLDRRMEYINEEVCYNVVKPEE